MREKIKGFVLGALVTSLVTGLGFAAVAAYQKQETLYYNDIKITLDGEEITPRDGAGNVVDPFIIEGTTYLPVRGISSALGLEVDWDAERNTVVLRTPGTAPGDEYGRNNPAPIGTAQTYTVKNYSEDYTATVQVDEVIRGERAYQILKEENQFNPTPEEGKEYLLIRVTAKMDRVAEDKAVSFNRYKFKYYSGDNREYTTLPGVVVPEPIDGNLYQGATRSGYICACVDRTDTEPKMVFGANYDGTGGVWFKLS